jgi:DNA-binding response OmpR family regulator
MGTDGSALLEPPRVSEGLGAAQTLADAVGIHLTARELELLAALMAHDGKVVQRQVLYEVVWGGQMQYRDRSVDVVVKRLRQKLASANPELEYVHTHYAVGYRFAPQPRRRAPFPISPSPDSPRGGSVD